MKKIVSIMIVALFSLFVSHSYAQVTIGSQDAPAAGAVLELKSDNLGFLPTRIALVSPGNPRPLSTTTHVQGMVVYNTTVSDSLKTGLYYNTGSKWVSLSAEPFTKEKWFYMPAISFDTSTNGTYSKELYNEFVKQLSTSGGLVVPSAGAPAKVLATVPKASDLNYYVTAYDDKVFRNISIDANGRMQYEIIGIASDSTFLNIVFVEK